MCTSYLRSSLYGLLLFSAVADAADSPALEVAVGEEADCFRFETYDAWVDSIPAAGAAAGLTREKYDLYRGTITCAFFSYTVDGVVVSGFSAMPKTAVDGKLPAVIYNRGGNGPLGRVTFARMMEDIFPLAARGFFVVGSQYREEDEFGGKDIDDVLALLTIIDRREDVAADRIGMLGFSRGGVTTMVAASRTSRIKALVLKGSPTDLYADLSARPDMEKVLERRIPGYSANKEAALRARSPLFLVEKIPAEMPILILHGSADARSRAENALQLATRLQALNRPYKLIIYPEGDHALRKFEFEVNAEVANWFESRL